MVFRKKNSHLFGFSAKFELLYPKIRNKNYLQMKYRIIFAKFGAIKLYNSKGTYKEFPEM